MMKYSTVLQKLGFPKRQIIATCLKQTFKPFYLTVFADGSSVFPGKIFKDQKKLNIGESTLVIQ